MVQSGGFLGRLLDPLLKTALPLIKHVIKPLAKNVLIPIGLTAVASAADAGIHKNILGPGRSSPSAPRTTALMMSNDEMKDIIEIIKSLEDSGFLLYTCTINIQFKMKLKNKRWIS